MNINLLNSEVAYWDKRFGARLPRKNHRNPTWKGSDAGYSAIHKWVARHKGTPHKCEQCGTTDANRYEWSNISGRYERDLDDYRRLCVSCHRREDAGTPWNKFLAPRSCLQCGCVFQPYQDSRRYCSAQCSNDSRKYLTARQCGNCNLLFQPDQSRRKYCSRQCYRSMRRKLANKEAA